MTGRVTMNRPHGLPWTPSSMRRDPTPDLTITVVHYRTPDLLPDCLERLERAAPDARVEVVTTSGEEPAALLPSGRFPAVEVIARPNLGYAATVNDALKRSRAPLFCHLNADVLVEPDTFARLRAAIASPAVGMVGPLCRDGSGRPQNLGLAYRRHYLRLARRPGGAVAVGWLSGCIQLVRREVVAAVGGMDATLRFFNEDLEWCWRLGAAGYARLLVDTEVVHLGGSSTPSAPRFLVEGYRGGYLLSRRYKGAAYRALHRGLVTLEALWKERRAATPEEREAYRQIRTMFRLQAFDESPFGATLDEANPRFVPAWPDASG